MGLHDPFGYLRDKLWPKEGSKVKLPIWLPTTKSQESPWFSLSLERSWQKLKLCFRPHLNWRSTQKVMSLQSRKSPNFGNFGTPNFEVPRQNDIWVLAPWLGIMNTIRGKVVASPKSRPWWVLWVRAPKVFKLCNNQLVVWFVQVHENNWPTCHLS